MGDRSVTVFRDQQDYSPGVYLHWNGSQTADYIKAASKQFRAGDAYYSAARFCGYCHTMIDSNRGLGLLPPPPDGDKTDWSYDGYGHGNAGVFIVDVETGEVTVHSDYEPKERVFSLGGLPA